MKGMVKMNNNSYFDKSVFPGQPIYTGSGMAVPNQTTAPNYSTQMPLEQSYI